MQARLLDEPSHFQSKSLDMSKRGFISSLFFCWVIKIMKIANKVSLENEMLDDLNYENKSEQIYQRFQKSFLANIESPYALIKSLFITFNGSIILCMVLTFLSVIAGMTTPIMINLIISYIQEDNKDLQKGVLLISGILFFRFFYSICDWHANVLIKKVGFQAISAIQMALMTKCMKISFLSNKKHSTGEVINLLQVDSDRLKMATFYICSVTFIPFQIAVALYLMFYYIGISCLAGVAVILLTCLINFFISKYRLKYQKLLMLAKDERTKSTNELFTLIKFIKINALELQFLNKVMALRFKELYIIKRYYIGTCFLILSVWITPMLIINVIFTVYLALGQQMTAAGTFTIISLFQILAMPLKALPMCINSLIQANVSLARIQNFLLTEELMTKCIQENKDQTYAIIVKNGQFHWENNLEKKDFNKKVSKMKEADSQVKVQIQESESDDSFRASTALQENDPILKDLQLKIKRGQFVAIVGDVGCGKSSLLQALLGEMLYDANNENQKIEINGSVAYVGQQAWIQNATVKDNILFGMPYDRQRYLKALKNSCLDSDIKILIQGDMTMIGEKGVNLSGGQKARISLARAVYSESDIYLLDDPISAVDVHVGKYIIHQCLNGYLRNKTRVLVTHAINYCQYTDYVYLMENGAIKIEGTFKDIQNTPIFQNIYQKFYKDGEKSTKEDPENIEEIFQQHQNILMQKQISSNPINIDQSVKIDLDYVDELTLAEDRQKGLIKEETFKSYFKMNGGIIPQKLGLPFFSFIILMVGFQSGISVSSNIWLANWTLQSQNNDGDIDNIYYLKIYSLLSLSFAFFSFGRAYGITLQTVSFASKIHRQMLTCLAYAPQCHFFERVPLGRIMNRFTKDQGILDLEMQWSYSEFMICLANLIGSIFLTVFASSFYVIIPVIFYFGSTGLIQRYYMNAQRELYRLESISKSPILSYFSETIQGLTVLRAFGRQGHFLNQHANNLDTNRKIQITQIYTNVWFQMVLTLCSFTVNITAIILCVINSQKCKVFNSRDNPAYAGLLMTYATSIDSEIQGVIQSLGIFESQMISFERCLSFTKVKPEIAYCELVQNKLDRLPCIEYLKYIDDWPSKGIIEFKDYKVQYRENLPPALKNVSLTINFQEKIGVVGRTGKYLNKLQGAGKSTITMSLLRILEAMDGYISIDGVRLSSLSLKQLRESVTMIMQDASIFEGSLRTNIDPLNIHTDQQILEILKQCCLNNLIESREGLLTKITESGANLSAGEKQLICIARAVLKKSKIVLIDEATANIDIETEMIIQETIKKQFAKCTVITIAHRINTILHCDKYQNRILVIDKGELKEFGLTNDLLQDKQSIFYGIFQEALKEQK